MIEHRVGVVIGMVGWAVVALLASQAVAAPKSSEVARFRDHRGAIAALALSKDGKYVLTASADKMCYALEATSLKAVKKFGPHPTELTGVAIMSDKTVILGGLQDPKTELGLCYWNWDSESVKLRLKLPWSVFGLTLSPDERHVAAIMLTHKVNLFRLSDGYRNGFGHSDTDTVSRTMAFSPGRSSFVMGVGANIFTWLPAEPAAKGMEYRSDTDAETTSIAFFPNGEQFVSSHADGFVRLWKVKEPRVVAKFEKHAGEAFAVAVSPDGKTVASSGEDKTIRIWDAESRALIEKFELPASARAILFVNNNRLVSGGSDGLVRLWAIDSKRTPIADNSSSPAVTESAAGQSLRPPSDEELAEAVKLIQDVFRNDYDALKRPADKTKLAESLLKQAAGKNLEIGEHFALLSEALRLSSEAGAIKTSLRAVAELKGRFELPPKFHLDYLSRLVDANLNVKDQAALSDAAFAYAEEASRAEDYPTAQALGRLAHRAAVAARDEDLQAGLREFAVKLKSQRERGEKFLAAMKVLEAAPDDAAANTIAGRHLCFVKGDWERGLGHLALSDDAQLKLLAERDLKAGDNASEMLALAAMWQEAAENAEAPLRSHYLAAAVYWYERALPKLSALQKLKAEQSLKTIGASGPRRQ